MNKLIHIFSRYRFLAFLLVGTVVLAGWLTAPFDWGGQRMPVPVDAIPNIGDNQQVVYIQWPGRSPQDIDDQITYPLTTMLLGIPGVKGVRSVSMFGFANIYVIFEDDVEVYWSRSRLLERLASLPSDLLPAGASIQLGPDATALGQVIWYVLDTRDPRTGKPVGGWELHELRSIQDFTVRYALQSVPGVAEVASVGGFVKEYRIDIDPDKLKQYGITLTDVLRAVARNNRDGGARTLEFNRAEYLVKTVGFLKDLNDLRQIPVKAFNGKPIFLQDIARIYTGPAFRRSILDLNGHEAVGGVVVTNYTANPMEVVKGIYQKIEEIAPALPRKTLRDGRESQVTVQIIYDRGKLINEVLYTLEHTLWLQILITSLVVLLMLRRVEMALVISALLPLAVLTSFAVMKLTRIPANIVSITGIAIAIGAMVDMGIVMTENIVQHLRRSDRRNVEALIRAAVQEVSRPLLVAVGTTILSFLPVMALQGPEGKMFGPLAVTKTYAMGTAVLLALLIIPAIAYYMIRPGRRWEAARHIGIAALTLAIAGITWYDHMPFVAIVFLGGGIAYLLQLRYPSLRKAALILLIVGIMVLLAELWMPGGPGTGRIGNFLWVTLIIFPILISFYLIIKFYEKILAFFMRHRTATFALTAGFILWGILSWQGLEGLFGAITPPSIKQTRLWQQAARWFPGLSKSFLPPFDEGAFLYMPSLMPHAGTEEVAEVLRALDRTITEIPEVELVLGKAGRVESALDPAPLSMFENLIYYKSEYRTDARGRPLRFRVDEKGTFVRDSLGRLIPDPQGEFYRQWREHIRTPDDIWNEIVRRTRFPGLTSASKLYPIQTRLIMLQTGMQSDLGLKIMGPDLQSITRFALRLEPLIRNLPEIDPSTVFAERGTTKPYVIIHPDKEKMAQYGLHIEDINRAVETLIGGRPLTTLLRGRERYAIRVRYPQGRLNSPEDIGNIWITINPRQKIPLKEIATIHFQIGPQMIRSENAALAQYLTFAPAPGVDEDHAIKAIETAIEKARAEGTLQVPAGVYWRFAGSFENRKRAEQYLSVIIPIALLTIVLLLFWQFRNMANVVIVGTTFLTAFAFSMIFLGMAQWPGFLNISLGTATIREIFHLGSINLNIAVWVGFLALLGVASDGVVLVLAYIDENRQAGMPIRKAVIEGARRRILPALMTLGTTFIALLPVFTSDGRGADMMRAIAFPTIGGLLGAIWMLFVVPLLYEFYWKKKHT